MNQMIASPGRSNFRDIIESSVYYVDKTDFILRLLEAKSYVTLVTRPRRFGKSLNLSMLKYFLTPTESSRNRRLFENLKVSENKVFMEKYQGKIPVIDLTMKYCKGNSYEEFLDGIRRMMIYFFEKNPEIEETAKKTKAGKKIFDELFMDSVPPMALKHSLKSIMHFMSRHYGDKVAVLIDEYDAPVFNIDSENHDERNRVLSFMSDFFGNALKDSDVLSFALITGVHRIAKENLFSGFNNLNISNVQNGVFSNYFGFTPDEVKKIAMDFQMEECLPNLKEWYDGYRFGETEIYNPWSIIKVMEQKGKIRAYWENTSKNGLVMEALDYLSDTSLLEKIYKGIPVVAELDDGFTYRDTMNDDRIFSLMVATGYLKPIKNLQDEEYELEIPNKEIKSIFRKEILEWCIPKNTRMYEKFLQRLQEGKDSEAENILKKLLSALISYHDTSKELFYHGLMLGLLVSGIDKYEITSNRESGQGRYDICLSPKIKNNRTTPGILIEIKSARSGTALSKSANDAIKQITDKGYAEELKKEKVSKIWLCGIAFFKKNVHVAIKQYKPYGPS